MGTRTEVSYRFRAGFGASLAEGDRKFDRQFLEQLDTLERGALVPVTLAPGQQNHLVAVPEITQVRYLLIEADGPVDVTLGAAPATAAVLTGAALGDPNTIVCPSGGHLHVNVDGTDVDVDLSTAGTITLDTLVRRINSAAALLGVGLPLASRVNNALQLATVATGAAQKLVTSESGALLGSVLTACGLTATTVTGTNAGGASSVMNLRRPMSDLNPAVVDDRVFLFASIVAEGVYLSNPSTTTAVNVYVALAGDIIVTSSY